MFATPNPQARPAFDRAKQIDEALRTHSCLTKRQLAELCGVSPRTVQRDLEFLRDRLRRPLAYDAVQRAYVYTEPVEPIGGVHLTDVGLRSLAIAKAAQMRTSANVGTDTFATLAALLPEKAAERLGKLEQAFYFKSFGEAIIAPEIFGQLVTAVIESTEVSFGYAKLGHAEPETRVARPLNLCCIDRMWYLLARDMVRDGVRTFALPRISDLKRTGRKFKRPKRWAAEKHLADSFGLITGETPKMVSIRFDAFAARLVLERSWHPSQQTKKLEDGSMLLTLWVGRFEEIERWILSWGHHARVLLPAELETRVKHAIDSMQRRYKEQD